MEPFGAPRSEVRDAKLLKNMVGTRRLELLTSTVSMDRIVDRKNLALPLRANASEGRPSIAPEKARKGEGKEAKLSYSGNLLVENRNGLIVNANCALSTPEADGPPTGGSSKALC